MRTVERGMSMAMEIDPNGGRAVEIPSSLPYRSGRTLSPLDNERLLLFPFLHLGKGMPEVLPVPISSTRVVHVFAVASWKS